MIDNFNRDEFSHRKALRPQDAKLLKFKFLDQSALSLPYTALEEVEHDVEMLTLVYRRRVVTIKGSGLEKIERELEKFNLSSISEVSNDEGMVKVDSIEVTAPMLN